VEYDVVFVHPPASTDKILHFNFFKRKDRDTTSEFSIIPMGLFSMASCLEDLGYSTKIIDLALEKAMQPQKSNKELINAMLGRIDSQIFAIDLHWFVHSAGAIEIAKLLKEKTDAKVILGGFTATFFAEEILRKYDFIDYIVLGEGEPVLPKLISSCLRSSEMRSKKGVAFRKGSLIVRGEYSYVKDLNKLNCTRLDLMDKWMYYLKSGPSGYRHTYKPSFWLPIGRGCSKNCIWCGGSREGYYVVTGRPELAYREPERVAEDITILSSKYNVKIIKLSHDPELFGKKYWQKLCKEVRDRGVDIGLYWESFSLPSMGFVREALKTFNVIHTAVTLDSINDEVRFREGRTYTNREFYKFMDRIRDLEVFVDIYFLIGLPGDSEEDVLKIPEFAKRILSKYKNAWIAPPFPYTIDPHAPMALRPKDYCIKKIFKSFDDYIKAAKSLKWKDWIGHETRELSRDRIAKLTLKVYKDIINMYNLYFTDRMKRRLLIEHDL